MGVELNKNAQSDSDSNTVEDDLIQLAVDVRNQAKDNKDWETSDLIRDKLTKLGIQLKDSKDGTQWSK
jgi:cysteinyl-tRNA synthetase